MAESERGAATREHILNTATAMFGEAGYRGASLRDIAARCGLTHPGLLYHFPTKAGLLEAVLMRRDQEDSRAGVNAHGLEALESLVRTARKNMSTRGLVELFATLSAESAAPDHPAHDYFVQRYKRVCAEVAKHYEEMRQDGVLRDGIDPVDAGRQWVALMDGLQIQWLLDDSIDMAGVLDAHLRAQLK